MNPRTKVIRQLVRESHYVVDERAVAEAIIVRSAVQRVVPGVTFRRETRATPQVRSFRPHRGGRSFRLTRRERRPLHRSGDEPEPSHRR